MSPVLNINVFGNFIKIGKKNLISFWAVTDYSRPPFPPISNYRSLGGGPRLFFMGHFIDEICQGIILDGKIIPLVIKNVETQG